jgi:hypothetical protein
LIVLDIGHLSGRLIFGSQRLLLRDVVNDSPEGAKAYPSEASVSLISQEAKTFYFVIHANSALQVLTSQVPGAREIYTG